MYSVAYTRNAVKELNKIPKNYVKNIIQHIDELQFNCHPHGSLKLQGSENKYRIRVGVYRIIYSVEESELLIEIIKIGARGDVYES
jgi:mRNA interferase RelE/StbE